MTQIIGKPLNRVDGKLKVTGGARYSAEFPQSNLAYAVCVGSKIARGRIEKIDSQTAEKLPGVLSVITYLNGPELQPLKTLSQGGAASETRLPLQEPIVHYSGEHIAVVVADTLEQATYAASLIEVTYAEETALVGIDKEREQAFAPEMPSRPAIITRGNPEAGLAAADFRVEETYTTPTEHHNPMEPHATTAVWEGDKLTVYDTTQYTYGVRQALATTLNIPEENVRVVCKFIGGAFGCKGSMWGNTILAVIAAREVGRPVKLVLTRPQMFNVVGHRTETEQQIKLGANRDGILTAIFHQGMSHTSMFDTFIEPFTSITRMMYACPNLQTSQQIVRLNKGTPTFMRAPGETPGSFALESALDELAYAVKIDPIELRLRNYADIDPSNNLPWSSNSLKECYQIGAEKFGWSKRNPEPGSMSDGIYQIGMSMASATFPALLFPATAKAHMLADGSVVVQSSTHEMGTGVATVMAQLAADTLGVSVEQVRFDLGDTELPRAPVSGGSATTASVGTAVQAVARLLKAKILEIARSDGNSPLHGVADAEVAVEDGRVFLKNNPTQGESYSTLLARHNLQQVEAYHDGQINGEQPQFSKHAFGAQFAEVQVDPNFGEVRVTRFTGVFGVGRVLNQKTARSQIISGIIMGIGMALMEETVFDPHMGQIVNANLGEYHVPVNADIPEIEVYFVPEEDPHVNPIGAKGIGEVGITGTAAAVANAIYHATGKRIRNLPITPDKVM